MISEDLGNGLKFTRCEAADVEEHAPLGDKVVNAEENDLAPS